MSRQRKQRRDQAPEKSDLVGQLISFQVFHHAPEASSRFGKTHAVDASLMVLTGPRSGQRFPSWPVMGAMARQMAELPLGVRHCARVTSGTTKKGHTWYGIDLDVDQHDRALADEYDRWAERLDDLEEEG